MFRPSALLLTVAVVAACASPGTITDDGQGSIPAAIEDVLTITAPEDGMTVDDPEVIVRGTAPDGSDVVLDVSRGRDEHTRADGGRWSIEVMLDEGDNLLTFRVGDDQATSTTLYLIYAPDPASVGATATATATATPEPIPTDEPEPSDEPDPTDEPEPEPLSVKVTKRTASLRRNQTASVTIKTAKGATCSIDVVYPSGSSTAKGLGTKKANGSGVVTWKWRVGGNTTKGVHDIYIWCEKGDREGSVDTTFRVR